MPSAYTRRRLLAASTGVLLAVAALTWRLHGCAGAAPTDAVVAAVDAAVRTANAGRMADLAGQPISKCAWVAKKSRATGFLGTWRAGALTLTVDGKQRAYVAVSRYQVCESEHDRLFQLVDSELQAETPESDTLGVRVQSHRMRVTFTPETGRAVLSDDVHLVRSSQASGDALLRLNAMYSVTAVTIGGRPMVFRRVGGFLVVSDCPAGPSDVHIEYSAAPQGTTEDFVSPQEAVLTSYWYPHTGRLPATAVVTVVTPRGWHGISNGDMESERSTATHSESTWRNDVPICYFTVSAAPYQVTSRSIDNITYSSYLLEDAPQRAEAAIAAASGALRWFATQFGSYPYQRYTVVESTRFTAALEGYSMTLCGRATIPSAVPHEVSHTWWGGIVPNTYVTDMWNEGLATYSDEAYRIAASGAAPDPTTANEPQPAEFLKVPVSGAYDAMDDTHSTVGYTKGSLVWRNLADLAGPAAVTRCLRAVVARHSRGSACDWSDLQAALTDSLGSEWAGYFDPWVRRSDLPVVGFQSAVARAAPGGYTVTCTVARGAAGQWISVPIVVTTETGQVFTRAALKGATARATVTCPAAPVRAEILLRAAPLILRTRSVALGHVVRISVP